MRKSYLLLVGWAGASPERVLPLALLSNGPYRNVIAGIDDAFTNRWGTLQHRATACILTALQHRVAACSPSQRLRRHRRCCQPASLWYLLLPRGVPALRRAHQAGLGGVRAQGHPGGHRGGPRGRRGVSGLTREPPAALLLLLLGGYDAC